MSAYVCVVGSLNMDLVVQAPSLPGPGETLLGRSFGTFPGGKGANQAVAASRFGGLVTMIGAVGDDDHGNVLRQGLARDAVDVQFVARRQGIATGVALITVADAGENTIVVAAGANETLTTGDLERAAGALTGCDVLLLQLEVPVEVVQRAAEITKKAGRPVVLNAAPAAPLPAELLRAVDVLVVNEGEAAILAGSTTGTDELARARALLTQGPRIVVVTLGARGALLVTPDDVWTQPGFAVESVDAVAAGDAFVGTFAVCHAEKRGPQESLAIACAAGALATTRPGAQASLPDRTSVMELVGRSPPPAAAGSGTR